MRNNNLDLAFSQKWKGLHLIMAFLPYKKIYVKNRETLPGWMESIPGMNFNTCVISQTLIRYNVVIPAGIVLCLKIDR